MTDLVDGNDAQTRVETCAACGERFVNAESKDGHYIPWSADRSPGRCRDPWLMTNLDGSYTYKCDHHEPSDRLGWECIWSLNEPKAAS